MIWLICSMKYSVLDTCVQRTHRTKEPSLILNRFKIAMVFIVILQLNKELEILCG